METSQVTVTNFLVDIRRSVAIPTDHYSSLIFISQNRLFVLSGSNIQKHLCGHENSLHPGPELSNCLFALAFNH